jgi:hypothetical protein
MEATMVTEVFVLCDGANDSHGKLNILGAFDMIIAEAFPFVHPHCTIALRLRYDHNDSQESKVRIIIQGAATEPPLASIDAALQRPVSTNPTSTANLIVNINSLRFEKPGDYSIILQVNGLPAAITPFFVRSSSAGKVH